MRRESLIGCVLYTAHWGPSPCLGMCPNGESNRDLPVHRPMRYP